MCLVEWLPGVFFRDFGPWLFSAAGHSRRGLRCVYNAVRMLFERGLNAVKGLNVVRRAERVRTPTFIRTSEHVWIFSVAGHNQRGLREFDNVT